MEVLFRNKNVPLSFGEIAQMIGKEQSNTASYIHHLLQKGYITREYCFSLDKIYEKRYFRPNITYYKFQLTADGEQRYFLLLRERD